MNRIAAQLRSAKHRESAGGFSVDQKLVGKRALLSAIGADLNTEISSSLQTKYMLWISQSFISRPVAVGVAGFVLIASGLMTTVNAAQESVPGDVLYSVKLINERAQIQLASLDRRAVLHTEFAERRLQEVEKLQSNSSTRNSSLVTQAMNAYTQEVASANLDLRQLQASGDTTTTATANQVDQNLSSLDSSIANVAVPVTSDDGALAVSTAISTTQGAQEDAVTVAVEVNDQATSETSVKDLQKMFIRQYGEITTRKEFDLHRIAVIRASFIARADVLGELSSLSLGNLSQFERSIALAVEDIAPAMDAFSGGGYQSAFAMLQRADSALRTVEASIAEIETAITQVLMNVEPVSTSDPIEESPQ